MMQIQVNTDANIDGREELARRVEIQVGTALARFGQRLTRVEVHLGDESAGRSGGADMRCVLEARPAGLDPVAVTHHAATVDEACSGATQKLRNLLDSRFGRRDGHKGAETIRTGEGG